MDRREMLKIAALGATLAVPGAALAAADDPLAKAVAAGHEAAIKRLRDWIALPTIAAEGRNVSEGAAYMAQLAREAGFQKVEIVPTDGVPGVFATMDNGARKTLGLYFMYDVKQFDPAEWSSPPLEGRIVERAGLGKVLIGRGAVNQKGPESVVLAALAAYKAAGRKPPVNLVLVCEGEEEIGSPHFGEVVHNSEVLDALRPCVGVTMPEAGQDRDGSTQVSLGAKGVIELELVSSGEKWGRGPDHDIHSSLAAAVDSPSWRLVQALNTLIEKDGHTPAVGGLFEKAKPLTKAQKEMIAIYAARTSEATRKKALGVKRWIDDLPWKESLERLVSQPTVNIEGLVGGYTGPGGKTVLPHRAVAKIDMRLVPDMTAADTLAKLKAHLAKKGFGDIEVNMSGGYDPNQTDLNSRLIQTQIATYRRLGTDPVIWPRSAGSWPGFVFTNAPLNLPAGHFGLGNGTGAHAPNEYYLIESKNPKVQGLDGAIASFVEYLYDLA